MATVDAPQPTVHATFETFRDELDEHHDRRERLIKTSRDVTILSKKIIFSLHRLLTDGAISLWSPVSTTTDKPSSVRKTDKQFSAVRDLFATMQPELQSGRFWRYSRSVSGGVQEYIEALAFAYYLEHHALIPYKVAQETFKGKDGSLFFPLTTEDYLLGVSDLTGEIMRLSITSIGTGHTGLKDILEVCALVRAWYADLEALTPFVRDLRKKQDVTAQSLQKIEAAAYSLSVRGAEYGLLAFGDFKYGPAPMRDAHEHEDDQD